MIRVFNLANVVTSIFLLRQFNPFSISASVGAQMTSSTSKATQIHQNGFSKEQKMVRIFMVGDVMLGRGVDQMLAHHVDPILHEGYIKDARDYLKLAIRENGPLPSNRSVDYVWGDAKSIFAEMKPDLKLINLETSVTVGGDPWPNKGIHYRMHPANVDVIKSANIDCCCLANNHVLDWGYSGLNETLKTFADSGIKISGAGQNRTIAESPAIFDLPSSAGRVLVFAAGSPSAGVPLAWKATDSKSGIHYFDETNTSVEINRLTELIKRFKKAGDIVVMSLHWGGNWGFDLEDGQQEFAKALIDNAQVDIIFGHSSHHIKGVEVYRGKLIAYGVGDFISDYEGIKGDSSKDAFRDDLSFMYFVDVSLDTGGLNGLTLYPMRLKHMQVKRVSDENDRRWLFENMRREVKRFGSDLIKSPGDDGTFRLVL